VGTNLAIFHDAIAQTVAKHQYFNDQRRSQAGPKAMTGQLPKFWLGFLA
jgi:hypothetical protein